MRRKTCLAFIVLFTIIFTIRYNQVIAIQQDTEIHFETKAELVVAFDYSHEPATTNYKGFQYHLETEGFDVETIEKGTNITSDELALINVLLIFAPSKNFTESELIALRNFVSNGGGVWLISDYTDSLGLCANEIAKNFGFEQRLNEAIIDTDDHKNVLGQILLNEDNIKTHNITKNVDEVFLLGSGGIITTPENATTIIETDNDNTTSWYSKAKESANAVTIMSVANYGPTGEGRFAYIVDTNFLEMYDQDNDEIFNFYESDNDYLAIDTVCWLANIESSYNGSYSYTPTSITPFRLDMVTIMGSIFIFSIIIIFKRGKSNKNK